jgi:alpha-beta hydrolase superfamily lysophospholipase
MKYFIIAIIFLVTFMSTSFSKYEWSSTNISFKDNNNEDQKFSTYALSTNSKTKNKKVIHILHGYTESCHYMNPFIDYFLGIDFDIRCLELPNHGSSSGEKYDIDNFETYLLHIESYIETLSKDHEHFFIGHSTGAVGITKYLKKYKSSPFKKIFLISPLTRPNFYTMIKHSTPILSKFFNKIKRVEQIRGAEYKAARVTDKHYFGYLPLSWTLECIDFVENQSKNSIESIQNVVSIFGTGDGIIDHKDGFSKYSKWFPSSNVHKINQGQHHIHFDSKDIRNELFKIIGSYL